MKGHNVRRPRVSNSLPVETKVRFLIRSPPRLVFHFSPPLNIHIHIFLTFIHSLFFCPSFLLDLLRVRDFSNLLYTLQKTYEKEKPPKHEKKEKPVDLSCGIWKFRTNAFGTKFANLYVFTVCVGISMLFTQMVHSVIHVQVSDEVSIYHINNKTNCERDEGPLSDLAVGEP